MSASITSSSSPSAASSSSFSPISSFIHPLDIRGNGRLILVSGASGFIAGHIISILLSRGFRVRGTVRDLKKTSDVQHLHDLAVKLHSEYPLELVEANLLKDEGWKQAIQGCEVVIHTASPFILETDDEASLIQPAVNGTLSVLRGAAQCSSVKRVILTSSVAAIQHTGNHAMEQLYDEKDWSEEKYSPAYPKSKTLAEKEAWRFYRKLHGIAEEKKEQKLDENNSAANSVTTTTERKWAADEWKDSYTNKFELCTINPSFVQGPLLSAKGCTSETLVKRFLINDMPGVPNFGFSVVDVRDVALAHVRAISAAKEAVDGERFILSADFLWMQTVAQWLAEEFDQNGYFIRQLPAPFFLLKIVALWDLEARHLLAEIGVKILFVNEKSKSVLGIQYIPPKQSILEMAYSLIEKGLVPDKLKRHPLDKDKIVKWQFDKTASSCPKCGKPFNFIQRRHHCRACGGVYCGECTTQQVGGQRACNACVEKFVTLPVALPVPVEEKREVSSADAEADKH